MEETDETTTPYETRLEDFHGDYHEPDIVSYWLWELRREKHAQWAEDLAFNAAARAAAYHHGQMLYTLRISVEVTWNNYVFSTRRLTREQIIDEIRRKHDFVDRTHIPEELYRDKKFAIAVVGCAPELLERFPDSTREDRDVVLAAVRRNGFALEYASAEMRADSEVVFEAIKTCPTAVQLALRGARADWRLWIMAMSFYQHHWLLRWAPEELKRNHGLWRIAVSVDAGVLEYAPVEVRADREIVFEAIKTWPATVRLALHGARADWRLWIMAMSIHQQTWLLCRAPEELLRDHEFWRIAVSVDASALEYASDEVRADPEVVFEAVQTCGYALSFASVDLRGDRKIVMAAVQSDPHGLRFASDELRGDVEVCAEAACAEMHRVKDMTRDWLMKMRLANGRYILLSQGTSWRLWHDAFFLRLVDERWRMRRLPRLCRFLLERHRQLKAARLKAHVDLWLIRRGLDGMGEAMSCAWSES